MKKRNMKKLNNGGYSLIEMMIVIAIIAVFAGASLITINVMNSAKAKEAAISFDSEIAELINKSKNIACDANADGVVDSSDEGYFFGIRVHKDGNKCYLQDVLVQNGVYVQSDTYEKANNPNDGKGISLSKYVYLIYEDEFGNEQTIGSGSDAVLIYFRKDGSCASGYGTYEFIRESNDNMQAIMTINKNGSHQSK